MDLTPGQKFGYLTVVRRLEIPYNNGRECQRYECKCDCGNTIVVSRSMLLNGARKSCGCRNPQTVSNRKAKRGEIISTLYGKWHHILQNPHDEEWDDLAKFKEWSLANGYLPHAKLVMKVPGTAYYGPNTCTWLSGRALQRYREATRKTKRLFSTQAYMDRMKQQNAERGRIQRKSGIKFRATDEDACFNVKEWAEILGMTPIVIYKRLTRTCSGTLEEAFQTPYKGRNIIEEIEAYLSQSPVN